MGRFGTGEWFLAKCGLRVSLYSDRRLWATDEISCMRSARLFCINRSRIKGRHAAMPRPQEFDDAEVLETATDHFWRHGYAATSVRDLGQAMGLVPASHCNVFGSKHALFTRCLD